ncbi:MAG: asparagine synthase (glutamine-hydrolyzing) [Candidatus Bathyarchaeota archaeon]|nr:asparagine synthase (glutamine-hydrolyzing) [Candidatus Bathyarchaeota archaeon]
MGSDANRNIKIICESLRHRGPDDSGYYFNENVALGHQALKLSAAPSNHQPLTNEDNKIWITFDGEIYNKGQLIEQLEKKHAFRTNSSAEVVVHSYEENGPDCVNLFNGLFAFCLWDPTNKQLFCARDRLGEKPLYYSNFQGQLIFASEIQGILAYPLFSRKPNDHFIYQYMLTGYPKRNGDTFFAGIKEILPGHFMVASRNGFSVSKYWHPLKQLKSNTIKDDSSYASEFQQLLKNAVGIRLPPESPVGTLLSGGLDSTSLVFIIDQLLKQESELKAQNRKSQELFSAIYESSTEQGDERSYIRGVGNVLETEINYVYPSVSGYWNEIKRFIFRIEEPVAVFNYYVFWCLFQAARQKVSFVFSGQGADALLGGQSNHTLKYLEELWARKNFSQLTKELASDTRRILSMLAWSTFFGRGAESKRKALLAPKFVEAHRNESLLNETSSLESALLNDVTQHSVEYLRVDDRASSAFSIECIHPFLDHRLVEFAFSLPANQKIRNGLTKYVLRKAMKGLIPEAIRLNKKKLGTPIPQQRWMRELQQYITNLIASDKFKERGYFDQSAVLYIFNRYCEGKFNRVEHHYYTNILWRIVNLELWFEIFFK